MNVIEVKNLYFGYDNKNTILKDINFKVNEGEFLSIIGENGSGKSTLIKCIAGLNNGYKGSIDMKYKIGYLPQRVNIQTDFPASVYEVVLSGTLTNNINSIFYKKEDKEKTKRIMKDLNIYDIKNKSFAELSGGQQQRVLIARGLCASDKILVLDEPTNGLDVNIKKNIYSLLEKINNEMKTTIIMISHDLDNTFLCSERIIEIKDGKVAYNGLATEYLHGGKKCLNCL